MLKMAPNFNQTINGSLLFGIVNIIFWIGIAYIWKQYDFKYSLEYWWIKFFAFLGKQSTKIELKD